MIVRTGVDLIEIARIEEAIARHGVATLSAYTHLPS
jgi:phosphopantetheinyl transferase (holo-ACP synthase)